MNTLIVSNNELQGETDNPDKNVVPCKHRKKRNLIGFWFLGVCNNYAYVIMLSAAFDMLNGKGASQSKCNATSTGAILLADILPSLAIKLITPFLNISINIRVTTAIFLSGASFLLTAFSVGRWMIFIGVICAALSSGLGEVTILSLTSYFHKDVVSTWSSGTGGAGVIGAVSYAILSENLGPHVTLQVMLIVPAIMTIVYWIVIERTPATQLRCKVLSCSESELEPFMNQSSLELSTERNTQIKPQRHSVKQKIALIKPLLKYMIPLGVVYFAEYFINQGLMELLNFEHNPFNWDQKHEYHWYQVFYQTGVFVSRSSVNFVRINRLWVLPVLQVFNLVFLLLQVYFQFIPSIIIVIIIILYEGLLGGLAYVNTFYKISEEIPEEYREFSMGVTSISDASGITLAGALAIPVHDALCRVLK